MGRGTGPLKSSTTWSRGDIDKLKISPAQTSWCAGCVRHLLTAGHHTSLVISSCSLERPSAADPVSASFSRAASSASTLEWGQQATKLRSDGAGR